jgi:hypothetical protein
LKKPIRKIVAPCQYQACDDPKSSHVTGRERERDGGGREREGGKKICEEGDRGERD